MRSARATAVAFSVLGALAASAQSPSEPVGEVANIRFYSDELMNLHHTLYAAAWANRRQPQALAQSLPAPLSAPFTAEERKVWEESVRYYDQNIAWRDLLSGDGMVAIKAALVAGDLNSSAIPEQLKSALESARPVFLKYFWPQQDRANRAWISLTVGRAQSLASEVIPKLEKAFDTKCLRLPFGPTSFGPGAGPAAIPPPPVPRTRRYRARTT